MCCSTRRHPVPTERLFLPRGPTSSATASGHPPFQNTAGTTTSFPPPTNGHIYTTLPATSFSGPATETRQNAVVEGLSRAKRLRGEVHRRHVAVGSARPSPENPDAAPRTPCSGPRPLRLPVGPRGGGLSRHAQCLSAERVKEGQTRGNGLSRVQCKSSI